MKVLVVLTTLWAVLTVSSAMAAGFPKSPDVQLTPGDVCEHPSEYRYPEHIAYCERNVESELKRAIIQTYDRNRGFSIGTMPRDQFKIDHFIPLCMGGSNDKENLWPQHESVYKITDPLEQESCEKMAAGRLPQAKAIALIREAKLNLSRVSEIRAYIEKL